MTMAERNGDIQMIVGREEGSGISIFAVCDDDGWVGEIVAWGYGFA
jgi:hypothetical protein